MNARKHMREMYLKSSDGNKEIVNGCFVKWM